MTGRYQTFSSSRFLMLGVLALAVAACGDKDDPIRRFEETPHLVLNGTQNLIAAVDVARMRKLRIYDKVRKAVLEPEKIRQWWDGFNAAVGLDPLASIDHLVIGFHGKLDLDHPFERAVVVMTGRFGEPEQLLPGVLKFLGPEHRLAVVNPPPFREAAHGPSRIFSTKAPSFEDPARVLQFHFGYASPGLVIFSPSLQYVKECLDVIHGDGDPLTDNKEWSRSLSRIKMPVLLWSIGAVPASVNGRILEQVQNDAALQGLDGLAIARSHSMSLKVGKEYILSASLNCGSLEDAQRMSQDLKRARTALPELLGRVLGDASPRIDVWDSLIADVFISNEIDRTIVSLRKGRPAVENFVRRLTAPIPTPAPLLIPAPFLQE